MMYILLGGSFWQKDSLVTLILFELCLLWYLAQSQILVTSLYLIGIVHNIFFWKNHTKFFGPYKRIDKNILFSSLALEVRAGKKCEGSAHIRQGEWKGNMRSLVKYIVLCRFVNCHMNEGRRACGHGDMGTGPHQVLAATLMLFQPGGAYTPGGFV